MICLIFYFVQDRFDLFDIEFISDTKKEETSDSELDSEDLADTFTIDNGELKIVREGEVEIVVDIEVVNTEEERKQGLMYRDELGTFSGMLFVFEEETNNSFWMKNTKISLDMIFINEGKEIVAIIENAKPCVEDHICPSLRPQVEYMYCLEVNGGFVEENRVEVGDTVTWIVE